MSHFAIGLVSFVGIFGGALLGLFAARRVPRDHLTSDTQTAITVSVAVIGTLAALVLGLMITTANGSFTKRTEEVRELSLQLIRMDRNLRRYGPEAAEARASLRIWGFAKIQQLFPDRTKPPVSSETTITLLEDVQDRLLALSPQTEQQKYLRTLCLTLSSTLIQARWALEQRTGHSTPIPFLVLLIFWLAIVFASFGLFAPPNPTTMVALFLCAVAVAGGIFLIEELDNPGGFIQLPSDAMQRALTEITQ
jgi:uncharacterized membrane protein